MHENTVIYGCKEKLILKYFKVIHLHLFYCSNSCADMTLSVFSASFLEVPLLCSFLNKTKTFMAGREKFSKSHPQHTWAILKFCMAIKQAKKISFVLIATFPKGEERNKKNKGRQTSRKPCHQQVKLAHSLSSIKISFNVSKCKMQVVRLYDFCRNKQGKVFVFPSTSLQYLQYPKFSCSARI